jgi:GT2 family glycosyltransferase
MTTLITVPTRGQIQWATVTALQAIRDSIPNCPPVEFQPGNLSVAQTRNKIVQTFFKGDYDCLMMVDDDVVPSPHFLERVLPSMDEYGMIALPHPMPHPQDKSLLRLTVFNVNANGELAFATDLQEGLHECDAVATGCVVISREALEVLGPHPFRITNDPTAEITSDDFLFCQDLKAAGFKIGYWWDGWFADHHSVTSLAPLFEGVITNAAR